MAPSIDPEPYSVELIGKPEAAVEEPEAVAGVGIEAVGHVVGLVVQIPVGEAWLLSGSFVPAPGPLLCPSYLTSITRLHLSPDETPFVRGLESGTLHQGLEPGVIGGTQHQGLELGVLDGWTGTLWLVGVSEVLGGGERIAGGCLSEGLWHSQFSAVNVGHRLSLLGIDFRQVRGNIFD